MIQLKGIHKKYQMGEHTVHALQEINLTIEPGEFVAIMGPSGSGKSTLMNVLGLLDVPDEGSYQLNGREVAKLSEDELALYRREEIGFIFQQFNLLPRITAEENVALPLLYSEGKFNLEQGKYYLNQVGLGSRLKHKTNQLSGGQQQRVAIARALVNNPKIVFADEPTGNLDSQSEKEILALLRDLHKKGITIIIVTHEESIGAQADRVIRMRDGKIQSDDRHPHAEIIQPEEVKKKERVVHSEIVNLYEYVHQGVRTLASNKVRSGLSMLGILIGVAAVVAMLALGTGAQKAIEEQLSSLGSNLLVLRSGSQRVGGVAFDSGGNVKLKYEDAQFLQEKLPFINKICTTINGKAQVTFENKNWSTSVTGASASYAKMRASVPPVGRFFTEEENKLRTRVAVIGMTVVRELFGDKNPIGEFVKINKTSYQVIGILPEKGASGWRDQDDTILVPTLTALYRLFGKETLDSIDMEIEKETNLDDAQDEILEAINSRYRAALSQGKSFEIRNMAEIQAALTESSNTMSVLLASIAAISLLVGGIGIMNIMLVSVTERTREIGLRKAVGARRKDILLQFLAESIVVSIVGGGLGIIVGAAITFTLSRLAGWVTSISPQSIILAFGFSTLVGIVFGIYPARKASQLNPIEALRYE